MYFKQFYLGCLAHASYLVGSDGEAAVVDPQRDVDQYIEEAEAAGLKIKYVIETHLHADFVSGHRELAARTGAEIVFSQHAGALFPHRAVKDGDELMVGRVRLQIMETPGHTPESMCVLVTDSEVSNQSRTGSQSRMASEGARSPGDPGPSDRGPNDVRPGKQKLLTGDTLFIGDVGRPDLAGGKGYTPEMMAAMMYDTIHHKLLKLPDEVEVYPAHGAGSMCGKSMSKERSSTIGEQRKFNYALQPMSKEQFVRMMTADLPEAPAYFPKDVEINRTGAGTLSQLTRPEALTPAQVSKLDRTRHVILDVRSAVDFGAGHVPGSLNIGLGGQFAMWAGILISMDSPIVLVAESEEKVDEAVMRLARVGIESVKGYLSGGIDSWRDAGYEVATVSQISVGELNNLIDDKPELQIVDVRRSSEYEAGHVPRALNVPLSTLEQTATGLSLNPSKPTAVICAGGYRSSAATSLLQRHGYISLLNVTGGTGAWINAGYPVEAPAAV